MAYNRPAFADVEREIRALAEEKPDKKADCQYVKGNHACCIFGHALKRVGVPHAFLRQVDNDCLPDDFDSPSAHSLIDADRDQGAWADRVQQNQDYGATWSQAVKLADAGIAVWFDADLEAKLALLDAS